MSLCNLISYIIKYINIFYNFYQPDGTLDRLPILSPWCASCTIGVYGSTFADELNVVDVDFGDKISVEPTTLKDSEITDVT
jgi:hypothetical protein